MGVQKTKMIALLENLLPTECTKTTSVKGLTLIRLDRGFRRTPRSYSASIIFLAQGEKRVYLGSDTFIYDSSHYLVLSVPMPIDCEAVVKQGKPLLGFYITIDPGILGEILLDLDEGDFQTDTLPRGIYGACMTEELESAGIRLLQTLFSERESKIVAPMIIREIVFRVLFGENGETLRTLAFRNRRFFQIAKVLGKIHESFKEDMDLKSLAKSSGMSISTFHSNFKAITNASPLQYIKNVRLHKARELMKQEGYNATNAAFHVGYESPSQFNREYKRYFGSTPAKDSSF